MHTYIGIHTYAHIYMHTHRGVQYAANSFAKQALNVRAINYIHTHIHTYIYMHTHICIHT